MSEWSETRFVTCEKNIPDNEIAEMEEEQGRDFTYPVDYCHFEEWAEGWVTSTDDYPDQDGTLGYFEFVCPECDTDQMQEIYQWER